MFEFVIGPIQVWKIRELANLIYHSFSKENAGHSLLLSLAIKYIHRQLASY